MAAGVDAAVLAAYHRLGDSVPVALGARCTIVRISRWSCSVWSRHAVLALPLPPTRRPAAGIA